MLIFQFIRMASHQGLGEYLLNCEGSYCSQLFSTPYNPPFIHYHTFLLVGNLFPNYRNMRYNFP